MKKIEIDLDDLGRAAYEAFYPDPWGELGAGERQEWCEVGIAVLEIVAERIQPLLGATVVSVKATGDATVEVQVDHRDLGKIGYSAYRAKTGGVSLVSGQRVPEWEALPESIKEAWLAAGVVIAQTVTARSQGANAEPEAAR